ncbi:uncharacterized protein LOC128393381 isoform X2 [Panonychus citri]|uniref:uncharacterized protein LOC128393381 isoform X2 n=1 Tax=Panonychus citri TaxID=50023 RepID=UPI0023073950|nr:uncharacterized protein LOC128393381 isoform X2 [Panonychus citri]
MFVSIGRNWLNQDYQELNMQQIIDLQSMIIDENFSKSIVFSEFSKFLSTSKTIKGLIEPFYYESNFSKFCPNIEMLVTCRLELTNIDPVNGPKLKQLRLFGYHSIFWENISNLINLESLYISFVNFDHLKHFKSVRIGFPNLITLIHTYWDDKNYVAFNLIDNCPKLRSVYLFYTRSGLIEINDQIENLSIKDFVFEFAVKSYSLNWNWNLFNLILTKYRNIEHLAIRGNNQLADLHVPLIVQLLPNLVLLDMRDSPLITSSSKQFIDSFNLLTKRSISFLFGQNKHFDFDPNNLNLIDIGPDFMRTHFFKHISQLPYLIDQ